MDLWVFINVAIKVLLLLDDPRILNLPAGVNHFTRAETVAHSSI